PEPAEPVLGFDVELEQLAGPDQHAHRDQDRASGGNDRLVVALDDREGGGHPREGEGGEEERDRQARRVDGEQEGAAAGRAGDRGGGEDRAESWADARSPGDREGGAGDDRPALAGALEQRVDVPLAVEAGDEEG